MRRAGLCRGMCRRQAIGGARAGTGGSSCAGASRRTALRRRGVVVRGGAGCYGVCASERSGRGRPAWSEWCADPFGRGAPRARDSRWRTRLRACLSSARVDGSRRATSLRARAFIRGTKRMCVSGGAGRQSAQQSPKRVRRLSSKTPMIPASSRSRRKSRVRL